MRRRSGKEVLVAFLLERGGRNLPLEVQRWQYFLRKRGFAEAGAVDGFYGGQTVTATTLFQRQHGVPLTGKLDLPTLEAARAAGYVVVPDNFYVDKAEETYPARPPNLRSPSNEWRNDTFGCFKFIQLERQFRSRAEEIVIQGSCDDRIADWEASNIVRIIVPQLVGVADARADGMIRCHRLAADPILALFRQWEQRDLMHLVISFAGGYVARYKKGKSPGDERQDVQQSAAVDELSNHSFGTAFDVNAPDNPFSARPALEPNRGALRELVSIANDLGFYWGGHFNRSQDGMHFELARID
jgi:hypothetical protein